MFLSFLRTYNFSSDHSIARRHETGNIPLPGVPTLSSFPILQQANKTLVSLLSFKDRLIGTAKFCFQNRKLKNMQVLVITRLSVIDPEQLNELQFVYMHVIDKQSITFPQSFFLFTHKLTFIPSKYSTSIEQQVTTYILHITGNW